MRPSSATTPLPLPAAPRWPACAAVLAVCLVTGATHAATVIPLASNAAEAATLWPRLFYTPAQRAAVVRARQPVDTHSATPEATGPHAPPPRTTFVLQGMAQGSVGASAWINGQMWRNGEVLAGRTIHIGQKTVLLHQSGLPDVVLRPGQTSLEPGQPAVDVVPAGTFIKK